MKKNKILISLAGAALLAVGTAAPTSSVSAESSQAEINSMLRTSAKKVKVTRKSRVYSAKGKKTKKVFKKGKKVTVKGTKTIKGKNYYKIGKNQYIKVHNTKAIKAFTPKDIVLNKKSYIYSAKGKKSENSLDKGTTVTVTGAKTIKGKKYYKIGKGQYIRVVNTTDVAPAPLPSNSNNSGANTAPAGNSASSSTGANTAPAGNSGSSSAGADNNAVTTAKTNAKDAIDKAVTAANTKIDGSSLNDGEKATVKKQVKSMANQYKSIVDGLTTKKEISELGKNASADIAKTVDSLISDAPSVVVAKIANASSYSADEMKLDSSNSYVKNFGYKDLNKSGGLGLVSDAQNNPISAGLVTENGNIMGLAKYFYTGTEADAEAAWKVADKYTMTVSVNIAGKSYEVEDTNKDKINAALDEVRAKGGKLVETITIKDASGNQIGDQLSFTVNVSVPAQN